MQHRTILFVLDSKTPDAEVSAAADAARQDETNLVCLLIGHAPALPIYAYGVPPYGGMNIPDN